MVLAEPRMEEVHEPRMATEEQEVWPSPETWARRLQRGDPAAVREVRRRVTRILAHSGLAVPEDERDDLEQDVMTDVWQAVNRSHFDVSAGFWGFVELVTSRRSIDWLRARREKRSLPEEITSPVTGPLGRALERERSELASEVLTALDPQCRELITLRLRDDLSYREIARTTGKTEGALRVQLYRCVRQARRIWERLRGDLKREGSGET
jgi:RNA polymerase sigma factor (sigma-70 family)